MLRDGSFSDMQNCPGDGCFRANSRHWMRWIYEYTPFCNGPDEVKSPL